MTVAVLGTALVFAASASAATPAVSTGGATHVTYKLRHRGPARSTPTAPPPRYYFQYGLTRSYGGQTAILNAGGGTKTVHVEAGAPGLQPLSVYH